MSVLNQPVDGIFSLETGSGHVLVPLEGLDALLELLKAVQAVDLVRCEVEDTEVVVGFGQLGLQPQRLLQRDLGFAPVLRSTIGVADVEIDADPVRTELARGFELFDGGIEASADEVLDTEVVASLGVARSELHGPLEIFDRQQTMVLCETHKTPHVVNLGVSGVDLRGLLQNPEREIVAPQVVVGLGENQHGADVSLLSPQDRPRDLHRIAVAS